MSQIFNLEQELRTNAYPGRGIVLGRSADDKFAIAAYFIMGRSANSRNRVFSRTEDGIRTQAVRPEEMQDPSLVIYHPVRKVNGKTIVTNGDQTDTIRDALQAEGTFVDGLRVRTFEPDYPNYTPRISGIINEDGSYEMSILKAFAKEDARPMRYFYEYEQPAAGFGHFIHTYDQPIDPLPSFRGEPKTVALSGDITQFTDLLWDSLNEDNKISLFVRYIDLATGAETTFLRNKYK